LLLQVYDGVSDEGAKARADFELRWKVALGKGLKERPFAKSKLQLFRTHLILHERVRAVFQNSLGFARQSGYFQSRKLKQRPPQYASLPMERRASRTLERSPLSSLGSGFVTLLGFVERLDQLVGGGCTGAHRESSSYSTNAGKQGIGLPGQPSGGHTPEDSLDHVKIKEPGCDKAQHRARAEAHQTPSWVVLESLHELVHARQDSVSVRRGRLQLFVWVVLL
jgi:hypothetical protein